MKDGMKNTFGIQNVMMEPKNFLASEYITDNYEELLKYAAKTIGNDELAVDLLNDVYIAVLNREENGEGYDPTMSRFKDYMTIQQFVRAQLKLYGKHERYHTISGTRKEVAVGMSSDSDEDFSQASEIARAYYNAPSYDDLELVELKATVEEELRYIISLEGTDGVSFRGLLSLVVNDGLGQASQGMFSRIRGMSEDILESLESVLKYGVIDHDGLCDMVEAALAA